jgi:hypothetical protein
VFCLRPREEVQAALGALQVPNEVSQSRGQSNLHLTAIEQLAHLARYCTRLAVDLRGLQGLPDGPE